MDWSNQLLVLMQIIYDDIHYHQDKQLSLAELWSYEILSDSTHQLVKK